MVITCFERTKPDCKIEIFYTTGRQKKKDSITVDGFCSHSDTVLEAKGCFHHFYPCQVVCPSLTEGHIQSGSEKREVD